MEIWLEANIQAHAFIPATYWKGHYPAVEALLPQAEVYVYEEDTSGKIKGFIGLTGDFISGLFVNEDSRSKGIGRQLLDYVKAIKANLCLHVYQKNVRALRFYRREGFSIQSEGIDTGTGKGEYTMVWTAPLPN